ncbi:Transglutaminase-like superfamily protein [Flavobacterium degerlachei]|uniref:Transglutaminase-like superfamily protein n=1 Tax=Flavobacterium degerlachei TaxID=229203 RepID=A0A1H3A2B5_9FLAO|nr:Transglutaminase-like superfamily protein [Flavobacterium degerlachei]
MISKKSTFSDMEDMCYNYINPKNEIPSIYFELNQSIFTETDGHLTDLKKAEKIANWLRNNIKGGPGLGNSSESAIRKMINGEGGVCSDFAQVYNNFCVINDLKVKEWGLKIITDEPQTKGGHSFNEIYSQELQKWILIDVAKCLFFYHSALSLPLSVSDLIALKRQKKEIKYCEFNKEITADPKRIKELYLAMNSFPFLITNYRNKICDYFLTKLNFLPVSLIHGILFLSGNSYAFQFPLDPINNIIQRPVIRLIPKRNPMQVLEEIAK